MERGSVIVDIEKLNSTSPYAHQKILCQCDLCGAQALVVKYSLHTRNNTYSHCQPCSAKVLGKKNIGIKRSDEHRRKTGLASKGRKPSALHMQRWMEYITQKNPNKISDRLEARERELSRRRLHSMLHGVLIRIGRKKQFKVHHILGYGPKELRTHLESQFQPGMTWDNQNTWHVDHIKPVSAFRAEGVDDPKIICALSNLRPLWKIDNLRKSAKFDQSVGS